MKHLSVETLDLPALIRAGESVVVAQGTAEPLALTEALVRQRHAIGGLRVFLGAVFSRSFPADCTDVIGFSGYGAIGGAAPLAKAGRLDPVPAQYSRLPAMFADGSLPADVVLLQLAPGRDGGPPCVALSHDYIVAAARRARLVIAELNPQAPWSFGAELPADLRVDVVVEAAHPPVELAPARIGEAERRIAALVAGRVPDRAVLETGIGAVPDAILSALSGHRDLGIHSGMIGDRFAELIEAGVVTNAAKPFDRGLTIAGSLFGSDRLFAFADRNPAIRLSPPAVTHGIGVMARIPGFTAINSAIEVDLSGQVNGEVAGDAYVGAVGGQVDFVRGALAAEGGRSVIALPSTARAGTVSRVVPDLAGRPVTCLRSDADLVVTEWGVAELRGRSLAERARRMIAVADPAFREDLARAAHAVIKAGD